MSCNSSKLTNLYRLNKHVHQYCGQCAYTVTKLNINWSIHTPNQKLISFDLFCFGRITKSERKNEWLLKNQMRTPITQRVDYFHHFSWYSYLSYKQQNLWTNTYTTHCLDRWTGYSDHNAMHKLKSCIKLISNCAHTE